MILANVMKVPNRFLPTFYLPMHIRSPLCIRILRGAMATVLYNIVKKNYDTSYPGFNK